MGKKLREDRERINVTFDIETYNQIKLIAQKENRSMSDLVRDWTMQGLNGVLTHNNLDVLTPIIRDQLKSIIKPTEERLASLSAKTCVQAGAAAYLTAETIATLLPIQEQKEFEEVYNAARKKAVAYMRGHVEL